MDNKKSDFLLSQVHICTYLVSVAEASNFRITVLKGEISQNILRIRSQKGLHFVHLGLLLWAPHSKLLITIRMGTIPTLLTQMMSHCLTSLTCEKNALSKHNFWLTKKIFLSSLGCSRSFGVYFSHFGISSFKNSFSHCR